MVAQTTERGIAVPKYHVAFRPTSQSGSIPQVSISDTTSRVTKSLPCLVDAGTYIILWVLTGKSGATAPGLIEALDTSSSANALAPRPIGFDAAGQALKATDSDAAQDYIQDYVLPP
jgi:hypothetical protein